MSLLLDALRKADREREHREKAPGIDTQYAAAPTREGHRRWLLLALVLALLALAAVVVWLWWARPNGAAPASAPVAEPGPAAASSSSVAAIDRSASSAAAPPGANRPNTPVQAQAVGEVYDPPQAADRDTSSNQTSSVAASSAPVRAALDSPEDDPVGELYRRAQTQAPAPANTATAPPQPEPASVALAGFADIGGIRDLPASVQNTIPSLMYAGHEYRPGETSEVVINGRVWREGDSIAESVVLEVIAEDGIVVRKGQHRFTLEALSSWVNM